MLNYLYSTKANRPR